MLNGYCECRGIRFSVDAEIRDFSHCHCSQCRRLHGAAFATFAEVPRADLRFESGEEMMSRYMSSEKSERWFCANCGSTIGVWEVADPSTLYLSMSALDGDPIVPEAYHIYVGSKAPWHEINDDLEQYEQDVP